VRGVIALSLVGAVAATAGGLIFWAIQGGTPLTRSIAYGFWFAAAACLLLMLVTGRRLVWRALPVAAYEGWVFTAAAVALTAAGAVVDTLGAG
jgi:hypothetical protein